MTNDQNGWLRPRPLRVAFLVQDGEHGDLMLDGIFADCYSRWGGRFSLLVPCINDSIPAQYWNWLELYDPDIVVSYFPLARSSALEIHERLNPAELIQHDRSDHEPPRQLYDFKPRYQLDPPLSSLSVLFRLAKRRSPLDQGPPLKLLDCWHTDPGSRFFLDNFGTVHSSGGSSFYPPDAAEVMGLVHVVSPTKMADRHFGIPQDLDAIPNEHAAFQGFAESRYIGIAQLAAFFAPKLELRQHDWSGTFNLVVGDSFADRVLFWNARHLVPAWLDRDLSCFRVTLDQTRDPDFLRTLVDMLNRRNRVNHGSGGQSFVTLRSLSCNSTDLDELAAAIRSQKSWNMVSAQRLTSIDEVIPRPETLRAARESRRYSDSSPRRQEWESFVWTPPVARPPHVRPEHLEFAPPSHAFSAGNFAVDYDFEVHDPTTETRRLRSSHWALPRRWRLAHAFSVARRESGHRIAPYPRRSRHGHLALVVSDNSIVNSIAVPSADDAVTHALTQDHSRQYLDNLSYPEAKVAWTESSNESRYLTGLLRLCGGLYGATSILLHPFLQNLFAKLGGSTKIAVETVEPTLNRLRKAARSKSTFDTQNAQDIGALAELVVSAARSLKSHASHVSHEFLVASWAKYREDYWAREHKPEAVGADADTFERLEAESLDRCLTELRKRKILFQGHRWLCPECHQQNWFDMSQLAPELACSICGKIADAPVSIRWLFRPNPFFIDALRDHSMLSLVWALDRLSEDARASFMFIGPRWYGYAHSTGSPHERPPDAESDLIALVDGQILLCEVKASWRQCKSSDLPNLVALAKRLRPDCVVLAVMDEPTNATESLEAAKRELEVEDIQFRVLTRGRARDTHDGPYLA